MRPISVGKNLVADTLTVLYTVPRQQGAKWYVSYIHNGSGSTKHISLWWYDKSANVEIAILSQVSLTAKTYLELNGNAYVLLEEGDEIRARSEAGSTFSIIVTVEQEYFPANQHGG